MKINNVNKRLASILMSGVILVTSTGCQRVIISTSDITNENDVTVEETTMPLEEKQKIEVYNYAYILNDTLLYDDLKDFNSEYYIEAYQKIFVKTILNDYALIEYNNVEGYIYTKDLELLPSSYVEIDISDQLVNLYSNGENILTSSVVTGKENSPTRIGYFDIDFKEYDTYLRGNDYCSHVYYWMPFDGGIGLHDAAWRDTFGGDIYVNNGSHGCVNLDNETAKTIYNNVSVGSRVLVHK